MRKIVLVRHGRSAHPHGGWVDVDGFRRWRQLYEAAGLIESDAPPLPLREAAANAAALVASDAPRAVESAQRLLPGRAPLVTPLLRELELEPPPLGRLRLPFPAWALLFGFRWLVRTILRRPRHSQAEVARAREAARWLIGIACEQGTVIAVTHASFRRLLASHLRAAGSAVVESGGGMHHWSTWVFVLQEERDGS